MATLAAAVTLAAASGCTAGTGDGPLSAGESHSTVCVGYTKEMIFTLGLVSLTNEGRHDIVITDAELIEPTNLELVGAVALPEPTGGAVGIGADDGWPPNHHTNPKVGSPADLAFWAKRQAIPGATVKAGNDDRLAIGVKAGGRGSMNGVRLTYTADGKRYQADTTAKLKVRPKCGGGFDSEDDE
ncbi:hypothetical protein [Streptomyces alkaliterrae]|uniref:Uncharacterized protein n=1 Tax=Streptomyces alkaliterrae TaxID=2213162 RepID=A0A5P0YTG0_9ACTN|nr:hypothetical protein [Streptomyces alkaliterrae]MBB1254570.1 hypothetical protein [Streptomyces alkaliterrae]MBB1259436.1 hypothetical protein [Streptomyces alkaliterrae]MQS02917.1 hypothetical protein [Streptomyces alkaliterrae]